MSNGRRFRRALVITPEIPEDSAPAVREGLARRAICATTGRCPCGAVASLSGPSRPGEVTYLTFDHDDACPASDAALADLEREHDRP